MQNEMTLKNDTDWILQIKDQNACDFSQNDVKQYNHWCFSKQSHQTSMKVFVFGRSCQSHHFFIEAVDVEKLKSSNPFFSSCLMTSREMKLILCSSASSKMRSPKFCYWPHMIRYTLFESFAKYFSNTSRKADTAKAPKSFHCWIYNGMQQINIEYLVVTIVFKLLSKIKSVTLFVRVIALLIRYLVTTYRLGVMEFDWIQNPFSQIWNAAAWANLECNRPPTFVGKIFTAVIRVDFAILLTLLSLNLRKLRNRFE